MIKAGLPYVSDTELENLVQVAGDPLQGPGPGSVLYNSLLQLQMIRNRQCDHEWEDAYTMSAEGIAMRGFRVCFRCDKIKVKRRR